MHTWHTERRDGETVWVSEEGKTQEDYRLDAEESGRLAAASIGGIGALGMTAMILGGGLGLPAIAVGGIIGGILAANRLRN